MFFGCPAQESCSTFSVTNQIGRTSVRRPNKRWQAAGSKPWKDDDDDISYFTAGSKDSMMERFWKRLQRQIRVSCKNVIETKIKISPGILKESFENQNVTGVSRLIFGMTKLMDGKSRPNNRVFLYTPYTQRLK